MDYILDKKTFNDLMDQGEGDSEKRDDNKSDLFTVLKNIYGRSCSKGYLCIELGVIYGDFNEVKPKKKIIKEKQKFHVIAKPIMLLNNTKPNNNSGDKNKTNHNDNKNKTKNKTIIIDDEEDCDEFNWDHYYEIPRFKVNLMYI